VNRDRLRKEENFSKHQTSAEKTGRALERRNGNKIERKKGILYTLPRREKKGTCQSVVEVTHQKIVTGKKKTERGTKRHKRNSRWPSQNKGKATDIVARYRKTD